MPRTPDPAPADLVLIGDPEVHAVPVDESGEPLVDVAAVPELGVDARLADPAGHHRLLRASVVARLVDAATLLPDGWRLTVVEGLRPPALQRAYFERYRDRLAAEHPDWPAARIERMASRHVAPPAGRPPHSTGGAVDLTVTGPDGRELDLGCPVNATPEESGGACYTDAVTHASAARARLVAALAGVGLVNYPPEWWHWSYGDRYWALRTGAPAAVYDSVPPDGSR